MSMSFIRSWHTKFYLNQQRTLWDIWCRGFCFVAPLWTWIKVKVTYTSIKMWILVISIIRPSLQLINIPMHAHIKVFCYRQRNSSYSHAADRSTQAWRLFCQNESFKVLRRLNKTGRKACIHNTQDLFIILFSLNHAQTQKMKWELVGSM